LLTVKACGLEYAISLLKEANPNQVVPLLNGVQHVTTLREALPNTHVVPATITVEAQRIGPTTIGHRSPFVRITAPTGIASEGIFKSLTRAGVEVVAGGSETEVLWRKFRFLAPMALLTAFHQQPLGEALDADASLTAQVLGEVAAVSTAVGLPTGQAELEAILRGLPSGMGSSLQTDRKSSSGSTMSTWVKLLSDRTLNPASSAPHLASGFIKA
jgi:2-dehydropantoate 2-reductase